MKNIIIAVLVTFILCVHGEAILLAAATARCQFERCI